MASSLDERVATLATYRHRLADIALPLLLRQLLLVAVLWHHRVLGQGRWSRWWRYEKLWWWCQWHPGAFIALEHQEIRIHHGSIQHFPHLLQVSTFFDFWLILVRISSNFHFGWIVLLWMYVLVCVWVYLGTYVCVRSCQMRFLIAVISPDSLQRRQGRCKGIKREFIWLVEGLWNVWVCPVCLDNSWRRLYASFFFFCSPTRFSFISFSFPTLCYLISWQL